MPNYTAENERQYQVVDEFLSIHRAMGDSSGSHARDTDIALLVTAIVLNAFVFVGDDFFKGIGLDPLWSKLVLGTLSVLTLVLTVVQQRMGWAEQARQHDAAANRLAALKTRYRATYSPDHAISPADAQALSAEYARVMESLPRIPERAFPRLKAHALRKLQISRRLSAQPGAPAWMVSWQVWLDALRPRPTTALARPTPEPHAGAPEQVVARLSGAQDDTVTVDAGL